MYGYIEDVTRAVAIVLLGVKASLKRLSFHHNIKDYLTYICLSVKCWFQQGSYYLLHNIQGLSLHWFESLCKPCDVFVMRCKLKDKNIFRLQAAVGT